MKYCLKTENGCLKTQTKHHLRICLRNVVDILFLLNYRTKTIISPFLKKKKKKKKTVIFFDKN